MSKSHIKQLKIALENSKWVIHTDVSTNEFLNNWEISRPNGDCLLTINFTIFGNGNHGAYIGTETMDNANGCSIVEYPNIDIYFGKYTGQFQKDLIQFIAQLEAASF